MELISNSYYFNNTNKAATRQHSGKLLLIVDWDPTIEFVYETYSIFVYENNTNNVTREQDRETKTNQKIIQEYINHHLKNDHETRKRRPENILACNPEEYPTEEIIQQTI